jgi:hypothetical protein
MLPHHLDHLVRSAQALGIRVHLRSQLRNQLDWIFFFHA